MEARLAERLPEHLGATTSATSACSPRSRPSSTAPSGSTRSLAHLDRNRRALARAARRAPAAGRLPAAAGRLPRLARLPRARARRRSGRRLPRARPGRAQPGARASASQGTGSRGSTSAPRSALLEVAVRRIAASVAAPLRPPARAPPVGDERDDGAREQRSRRRSTSAAWSAVAEGARRRVEHLAEQARVGHRGGRGQRVRGSGRGGVGGQAAARDRVDDERCGRAPGRRAPRASSRARSIRPPLIDRAEDRDREHAAELAARVHRRGGHARALGRHDREHRRGDGDERQAEPEADEGEGGGERPDRDRRLQQRVDGEHAAAGEQGSRRPSARAARGGPSSCPRGARRRPSPPPSRRTGARSSSRRSGRRPAGRGR